MSDNLEVSAGIGSPAADAGSASGAVDLGGQQESNGVEAGGVASPPAGSPELGTPAATGDDRGLDAGAGAPPEFSEEEIESAPDVWREKFRSLLSGHKGLEADHRALKQEAEQLRALVSDLNGFARDEHGNMVLDPESQLPVPSTAKFVERLYSDSPAVASQLFRDLWAAPRPDGKTNAQAIFEELGLDPARYEDYVALTRNPRSAPAAETEVPPDELASIPEQFHDLYRQLTPRERFRVQSMDDAELGEFFEERRELIEARQFREEMRQREAEREKAEMSAFWEQVNESHRQYAEELRKSGFDSIRKSLAGQVTFSADPTIQSAQVGTVMTLVAALMEPTLRDSDYLQSIGVQFDPQFDAALQALERHTYAVKRLEAIAANPRLASERNDSALRASQAEVKRLYDQTVARLHGVALKIAKAITTGNQDLRDTRQSGYQSARPTVRTGAVPSAGASPARNGADPFTVEWLMQRR